MIVWLALVFAATATVASAATLDQFAAMTTVLRAELAGNSVCIDEMKGIPATALSAAPQLLHARFDRAYADLPAPARLAYFDEKRLTECTRKCRCGIYAMVLATSSDSTTSERSAAFLDRERKFPLDEAKVARCARANRDWVCGHPIFRAVIREARDAAKGGTE